MKNSMYKQVGFFFIFEIMVSKEPGGLFYVLSPSLSFIFLAFLFSCCVVVPCGETESKVQCKTVSGKLH